MTLITKKVAKKISFLRRMRPRLDFKTSILLYKSIISPHFDFCSTILFLSNEGQFRSLQLLQNRALRIICKSTRYESIESMLTMTELLDVKQRVYFNVLMFMYKIHKGVLPDYLCLRFQRVRQAQSYELRRGERFRLPALRTSDAQNCLSYKAALQFNDLMGQVDIEKPMFDFKRALCDYVKNTFLNH